MKRKLILAMATLFIGIISLCCLTSCSSAKVVDFGEYTTVSFSGYNGSGYATVKVDYETIAAMLGDQNTASALMVLSTIKPSEIVNNGSLSNGDKIKVTIEYNDSALKEVNIAATNTELEFEVKGLEEKQELDVFSDVEIVVSGNSPFCQVSVVYNGDVAGLQDSGWASPFIISDVNGESKSVFKNGETVLVSLSENEIGLLSEYNIKETSKEYTVTADTSYIVSGSDLSADTLTKLDSLADETFKAKADELIESGMSMGIDRTSLIKEITSMSVGSAGFTKIENADIKAKYVGCTDNPNGAATWIGSKIYSQIYYFYDVDVTFDWKYFMDTGTETAKCTFALCLTNPTITGGEITYTEAELIGAADQAAAKSKLIDNAALAFEEF